MNRIVLFLLAIGSGWLIRAAAAAPTDPAQIMNEAYINLVQGDQSLDAGRLDEALSLYTQAREYYQQLARDFPGFEPRIIQYRNTYCDNQITDIERRRALPPPEELPSLTTSPAWPHPTMAQTDPSAPALDAATHAYPVPAAERPMAPAAPSIDRSVELDYLKSKVDSLESALEEFDSVQDELDRLVADNRRLSQELAAAQRQLELRTGDDSERQALRDELAERDRRIQALMREVEAKSQLNDALNAMEAKVTEVQDELASLQEEAQDLRQEIDEADLRALQATERAKQAEANLEQWMTRSPEAAPPPPETVAAAASSPAAAEQPRPETAPPVRELPVHVRTSAVVRAQPLPIPEGMSAADFIRRLLEQGENESALATVRQVRLASPDELNLQLIEGIALIRLQMYPEAASLLIESARRNPRNPEVNAALGAAMMGAGYYDEAREALQLALGLDRNLPECHYNLAQLYGYTEPFNHRLARHHYRRALGMGIPADADLERAIRFIGP